MGAVTYGDVLRGAARPEELVPFGGEQAHKAFALALGLDLFVDALAGEGYGAVLVVAPPEADPVPELRERAGRVETPRRLLTSAATLSHDGKVWIALCMVYVLWGSTYLGIELAGETIPPLFAVAWRFLVAGTLMAGWVVVAARRLGPARLAAAARLGRPHRLALARSERVALRRRARGADRPRLARDRVGTAPRRCAALRRRRPADSWLAARRRDRVRRDRAARPAERRRDGAWPRSRRLLGRGLGGRLVPVGTPADAAGCVRRHRPRDARRRALPASDRAARDRLRAVGVVGAIDLRLVVSRRVRLALRLHRLRLAAASTLRSGRLRRTPT